MSGHQIALRPPVRPAEQPVDDIQRLIQSLADLRSDVQQLNRTSSLIAAPWLTMPPDGESFHLAAGIGLPAISATAFATVVQIPVPEGRNGVLNRIGNVFVGGGFTDFSGDLVWQIVRNPGTGLQTAERNYENIVASLGSVANPGVVAPIRLFENDVIALVVRNAAIIVALQKVGGLLGGWFYPRTWDDAFERSQQAQDVSW